MNVDMDMDKQLWGQDWDEHEAETDFQSQLRSQFKLAQKWLKLNLNNFKTAKNMRGFEALVINS